MQLIRLCENMELDHKKTFDVMAKKKKFLMNEEELKMPPSSSEQVWKYLANECKEETTQIKMREQTNNV